MNWIRGGSLLARWGGLYAAAALQVGVWPEEGPRCLAMLAAWWVWLTPRHGGVTWCLLAGLALDLTTHGRLGLNMATYGVLAAIVAETLLADERRVAWQLTATTAWFTAGSTCLSEACRIAWQGTPWRLESLWEPTWSATWPTVVCTVVLQLTVGLFRRLWATRDAGGRWELHNEWRRLSEA